jgi:hypothetical protein
MTFDPSYLRLQFAEAIDFLRSRVNFPTENFSQSLGLDFRVIFAVASAKGSLLADLRRAVDLAISNGESLASFRGRFDGIVALKGWDYRGGRDWRSRLIWETNLRVAHAAGRTEQMQRVTKTRPYWWWRHGKSREPRPAHKALDGIVIRHDDPFWTWCDAPHGFGCKCTKVSLSERDLTRLKLVPRTGPVRGGLISGHPLLPEPGWGPHGPLSPAARAAAIEDAASRLPPEIRAAFRSEFP